MCAFWPAIRPGTTVDGKSRATIHVIFDLGPSGATIAVPDRRIEIKSGVIYMLGLSCATFASESTKSWILSSSSLQFCEKETPISGIGVVKTGESAPDMLIGSASVLEVLVP